MEREPCVSTPHCKYWESGCFKDRHHIYQLAEANAGTERRFALLGQNVVHICRGTHEDIEAVYGWPQLPEVPVMIQAVHQSRQGVTV